MTSTINLGAKEMEEWAERMSLHDEFRIEYAAYLSPEYFPSPLFLQLSLSLRHYLHVLYLTITEIPPLGTEPLEESRHAAVTLPSAYCRGMGCPFHSRILTLCRRCPLSYDRALARNCTPKGPALMSYWCTWFLSRMQH
ncbi:uncharacterized protein LAJ45_09876 [Morchella importuna]|uniref:uncharacterized protein n=1 Tax=Morchella importuna TaxID=1174673 RepID=UPI001E8CF3DC|nr:uncharacterized protein LAJ45_09876 [Morchella importuna]KAH8146178.1 hypothetical protein LAJ45_09876 [Morchella importuna]